VLQVRYFSIVPKRQDAVIRAIELRKGTDKTSPVVLALTLEPPVAQVAQKPKEKPGKAEDDKTLLQGRWYAIAEEADGKALSAADLAKLNKTLVVSGDGFDLERQAGDERRLISGQISLDQTDNPKKFDFSGKASNSPYQMYGIYEVSKDTLKLCYTSDKPSTRPVEFRTTPKSGHRYVVFKRKADKVEVAQKPKEEAGKKEEKPTAKDDAFHSLGSLPLRPDFQAELVISPNGKLLASGGLGNETMFLGRELDPKELHRIYIADLLTGKTLHVMEGHTDQIKGLGFSPNSQSLFSGSGDGSVREWDMTTGREKRTVVKGVTVSGVGIAFNKKKDTTIAMIVPGKAAALDGRLKVGDRLTAVSGHDGKMVRVFCLSRIWKIASFGLV
jgi:uncharacterized protein (TIGR03067 family)